jgi:hypothetical protein
LHSKRVQIFVIFVGLLNWARPPVYNWRVDISFTWIALSQKLRTDGLVRVCVKDQHIDSFHVGTRITFGFLECALCKQMINHPALQEELKPILELKEQVKVPVDIVHDTF